MNQKICKNNKLAIYEVGSRVEEGGYYVCVPCGKKLFLKVGALFPSCINCMKSKKEGAFKKGLELWEKLSIEIS